MCQGKNDCFERACGPFVVIEMRESGRKCRRVVVDSSRKKNSSSRANLDRGFRLGSGRGEIVE